MMDQNDLLYPKNHFEGTELGGFEQEVYGNGVWGFVPYEALEANPPEHLTIAFEGTVGAGKSSLLRWLLNSETLQDVPSYMYLQDRAPFISKFLYFAEVDPQAAYHCPLHSRAYMEYLMHWSERTYPYPDEVPNRVISPEQSIGSVRMQFYEYEEAIRVAKVNNLRVPIVAERFLFDQIIREKFLLRNGVLQQSDIGRLTNDAYERMLQRLNDPLSNHLYCVFFCVVPPEVSIARREKQGKVGGSIKLPLQQQLYKAYFEEMHLLYKKAKSGNLSRNLALFFVNGLIPKEQVYQSVNNAVRAVRKAARI